MVIEAKPMLLMLISGQKLLKKQMQIELISYLDITDDEVKETKLKQIDSAITKCDSLINALNHEYLK